MPSLRSVLSVITAGALVLGLAACQSTSADEAAPEASSDSGFPLTIEHAMGETTIPERPIRVVALDPSYVDATLLLGAELVGYAEYRQDPENPFAPYLGDVSDETADAVNVGTIAEPDLEKILELEPDLIISAKVRQEALYPQLSKIAPTVFSESTGPTWKENVVLLGTALGLEDEAEAAVSEYEERAAAVGEQILAQDPETTYSLVRFAGEDTARLYSSNSFIGEIMTDMGLPRPADAPDTTETIFVPLSAENILQADASIVLVSSWEPDGAEGDASRAQRAQFESNPLWERLTGEVVAVDDGTFVSSVSIQGAHAVITELAEHFGVDPLD
ncbi:iron-siderophore ABC transporter substrate-binding protein [Microbacterium sp. CFH 90308]|uniref:Iron-siderophore ABC transporter substrate-binding protein n=1 Tax=Microbacterium salsuginis TaxID=2722803 RepID=A0ABX1KBY9_9MICO|nr:iron-siderophore ABC transporter substrate-binding protein [Microbacterium sp. CFH 90308]NLP84541.1 iron-siderophore ABC transporter substrate-binding protein [Microbacterium sp. CFH 90308]